MLEVAPQSTRLCQGSRGKGVSYELTAEPTWLP